MVIVRANSKSCPKRGTTKPIEELGFESFVNRDLRTDYNYFRMGYVANAKPTKRTICTLLR